VGAQDGAARVEVARRGEDQPGTAGIERSFELFRVGQIVDRYQHPARRKDAQGCCDPGRGVGCPERDCPVAVDPTFTQVASPAQRLLGKALATPRYDAMFPKRDDGWVPSARSEVAQQTSDSPGDDHAANSHCIFSVRLG
jgi:hypothetical protein